MGNKMDTEARQEQRPKNQPRSGRLQVPETGWSPNKPPDLREILDRIF